MFDMNGPPGFGFMGMLFPSMFTLVFLFVFGIIIFTIIRNLRQWNYNNKQPVLIVDALVISKRTHVSRRHHHHGHGHGHGHMHSHSSTSYYVTFEVESGDRMELSVNGSEYGLLAEGDAGRLKFQGTRYLGFDRI